MQKVLKRTRRRKVKIIPTSTKCAYCGNEMVIIPGDRRDMLQCQNWDCPRDHQPQGYILKEKGK